MLDITGREIEVGQWVESTQQYGGVLPPGKSSVGRVIEYKQSYKDTPELAISCNEEGIGFPTIILLEGKLNEIIDM